MISDLAYLGCEEVVLSGGEALLSPDWERIAQAIVTKGMVASLISNGLLIDAAMALRIKKAGITLVALSIDGLESTHNYIRNHPKAFAGLKVAAHHLGEMRIQTNFLTTIMTANLRELRDIEDVVVSLGGSYWQLQLGCELGRMRNNEDLVVRPTDLAGIVDFIIGAKKRGRILINVGDSIGYYSEREAELRCTPQRNGLDFFCGCSAGCLNVGIESDGNVKGCLSLQDESFIEGNLRDESLITIWQKKGNFAYNRNFKISDLADHCSECEFGELCRGGCATMSFAATGKLHANPYCLRIVSSESKSTE
jgi:radical SAM protein with 4Fe4S-binding SPASM domain